MCRLWTILVSVTTTYQTEDIEFGLSIAEQAANRLNIPFLVIDMAKTREGNWIIIECNDAQKSGYTGICPQPLWQKILVNITEKNRNKIIKLNSN